ncbi:MAG: FKBP-type peptidyl-prolyl cis-trans isomerase [Candidatus Binatia bacterium]
MVRNGSVVSFEYTLSDENGEVLQSNKGKEPVTYTHGQHEIISGLEKGLSEMEIDEEKSIRVNLEEAYGPVDPKGFKEVPKSDIPTTELEVGTPLNARGPQGEELLIHVCEVKDDTVVLDFNHPFAGKTLNFDVKVVDIEPQEA